jgi:chromosome segregation ATPase
MNPNQPGFLHAPPPPPAPSGGGGLKIPILFGSVLALLGANIYLFTQLDKTKNDVKALQSSLKTEIQEVQQSAAVSSRASQQYAAELKDELEAARRAQAMAVGQAKLDAEKKVQELERTLKQETKAVAAQMTSQISEVKEQTLAVNTRVGEVSTEVGAVKTEVATTKTELEKTIGDLKRVRGDLGEQSGLIATNGKELQALKALGERNYFEFRLPKSKQPQRVGDIMLTLKKADVKKNRFTVELIADDKKVEKKDKSINEPLQFYTSKARQPYELVINEVSKDLVVGYLATPKVQNVRN